jgi:hypothetical protein
MSAILYPIAPNAETAMARPLGRAAREPDALALARGGVSFTVEAVGPAFPTYEAAVKAWAGRVDDEIAGRFLQPTDRYCTLREVVAETAPRRKPRQAKAVFRDGRRWAAPLEPPPVVWRLSVSYWRVIGAEERAALEQARKARKKASAQQLGAEALRALVQQPLMPVRPQQPLDIGLFEFRPPEAPHMVIPDE